MEPTKVLFVTSECVPFIKTGGLADVAGALPKYFDKTRYDVRVIMPKYTCIPDKYRDQMKFLYSFTTGFHFRDQYVGVFQLEMNGVTYYFLDSEYYFSGSWPYDTILNDLEKFCFFCHAVLSTVRTLDFRPDILHCHDWQAGMVPVYLNSYFQGDLFYHGMKTVMTIHNLRFKGEYDVPTVMDRTGLSSYYFSSDKMELNQNGSLLKGGLVYSDYITTVSPSYKEEIKTAFYGEGLDGLMRARSQSLYGILNGIDYETYDPAQDPSIPFRFKPSNLVKGKEENKLALQRELGLPEDKNAFVIGLVSRLTDQKGIDLITCVFEEILKMHVQFIVLGTGESRYEYFFRGAQAMHPDKVRAEIYYSEALSRRIYAGTDAFLMPSLFEPCGLSQLLALRYGSAPIVRETGGLKDTVHPYNEYEGTGNGFSFTNYNAHDMLNVIRYAESTFRHHKKEWHAIVRRGMEEDFSWNRSAREYEKLYDGLIRDREEEKKRYENAMARDISYEAPSVKEKEAVPKTAAQPKKARSTKKKDVEK